MATMTDHGPIALPPLHRGLPYRRRRALFLLTLGAPAFLYVTLVGLVPICEGAWLSLFDDNLLHPARRAFVGLQNYRDLLRDGDVRAALLNTVLFTVGAVGIEFLAGLGLALLLWPDSRFNRVCLALLLVPVTVTPVVVGLIFKALLAPDGGFVGYVLAQWGWSDPRGLLGDRHSALAALIVVDAWEWTPLVALILLAGLKALPGDILEAARADGATGWQRFRLVILPLLLPAVFLALILRIMDAFRVFDIVFVTTAGGPADATQTLMLLAVKQGLQFFDIGMASALGNIMLGCIAVLAGGFALLIRRADRAVAGR
jgi:multiple sugar transport system permease protein